MIFILQILCTTHFVHTALINFATYANKLWKCYKIVFQIWVIHHFTNYSKKISFKVLSLKWPIMPNATESTRVIDFWRDSRLARNEDTWFRDKTTDLRNVSLRILTVDHPPSVIKYRSPDGFVSFPKGTQSSHMLWIDG